MPVAPPRGLTAIRPLLDAGATVAAGADNLQDPFNLVGRADPMETAALMVMAGHLLPAEAYVAVERGPAAPCSGCRPCRIEPGAPAELLAIRADSLREAIATAPLDRLVVHAGRRREPHESDVRPVKHEVHTGVTADRELRPRVAAA